MAQGSKQWNRKGQGTVEYILILAVIIAAIAVAANALIKPAVTKTMDSSKAAIENAADKLAAGLK